MYENETWPMRSATRFRFPQTQ